MKDPYSFDVLALGPEMSERELERGLLGHLQALLLELGKGLASAGRQHHRQVDGQGYDLDLLFYRFRLRCFLVVDLKFEEFRHEPDSPSTGIILCKGKNEVIVEYAPRYGAEPMGEAEYRLSTALPESLRAELPTAAEFAREFPLLSLVTLRTETERELRAFADEAGLAESSLSIGATLAALERAGKVPHSTRLFQTALQVLNQATQGHDADADTAAQAAEVAGHYLADRRAVQAAGAEETLNAGSPSSRGAGACRRRRSQSSSRRAGLGRSSLARPGEGAGGDLRPGLERAEIERRAPAGCSSPCRGGRGARR
ncbi:PDDEXK nuclease domain-containing protein [Methylobacterium tarhaniae]|uniref:PDDEXK nuclease domain-containing protein n=1 Tax=Methylobacterium tarhaniae TaxID=1187852 RepID=UPI002477F889|nr:PDDEXK nuclease domain-containing protein [Methylobacterium tarhaniae]